MRRCLFLFIIILAAGCRSESEIPENIIPKDKMMEILTEFHLLESKIENLYIPNDSARMVYNHFEPQVFEKYGVDSANYMESLSFYLDHPELLHDIYEGVVDSLMVREKSHRID